MADLTSNSMYDHAFAVVRVDDYLGAAVPCADKVSVVKVLRDAGAAGAEVERLNALKAGCGQRYFTQVTRLERSVEPHGE